ncbi:low molecular weight protein arginine phosphatase [Bacillus shivajii]|uniref:low molecular weight protein arginine phosphatase n=1 Tax=Bacillus shivajii TaxID=1983719 RepID=UPI001CFC2DC1|nr:low molecular weight protein arginine phosphatase [Bacillus shivajii]UCZ53031.1 low molecular weight protein arginine phosphatase [Bacillus shivajii]
MKNVLFICTGNTCRSPLAEAVFEHKKTSDELKAKSAGIHAMEGMPISEHSKTVLENKGFNHKHEAKVVDPSLLKWADVILTMTESHKRTLIEQFPEKVNEIYTLKEFVHDDPETTKLVEELKDQQAHLELKRAKFIADNQGKIEEYNKTNDVQNQQELEKQLLDEIIPHQNVIDEIAGKLPSFDISDPFGADVERYDETLTEIEKAVEKLLKKLK